MTESEIEIVERTCEETFDIAIDGVEYFVTRTTDLTDNKIGFYITAIGGRIVTEKERVEFGDVMKVLREHDAKKKR